MQQIIGDYIFHTLAKEPPPPIITLYQIHSNLIISPSEVDKKADGFLVYDFEQINDPLCILTADCLPIFILGKKGFVFLHAGWKGLANGILFQKQISQIIPHTLYIGPCIYPCCYEVATDFIKNFNQHGTTIQKNHQTFFDLITTAKNQITSIHPDINFIHSNICTCCNQNFHSYRRNKTSKRNYNIIIKR
ncbi:MAG: hypothetical protein A2381_03285 [Bdellovibrionales bacterium RIFOXYB1_FULL_37_110]|nr:MAG: hypothetical protein A2181_00390 [Bdellovibrionales bacterium RIFOXYA1_FULL_38_20]OFZ48428.1 MAG: hypothetical protein A2417_03775 [Bdellovibrionales bacterium RIFOXYC1_FULL_37_79]OFZ55429.1 MAG: hypothetical protein A2328_11550 [Bdellovibrionales bacterium RIFOXYB2_FULL_36_6]OFZ57949.1 MAG: hypothetical protein A2381_03285 [Bdellovibrionales bacterium RIFOXYB1_FULL_37_110]OFZ63086.1 MAG: hypothetical protein A2577_15415 [Bdellovibrionales bacterium RIFOXYD1_FULL_36_51]